VTKTSSLEILCKKTSPFSLLIMLFRRERAQVSQPPSRFDIDLFARFERWNVPAGRPHSGPALAEERAFLRAHFVRTLVHSRSFRGKSVTEISRGR